VATLLLADLEQAELESRARRLAAQSESDRRLAAAHVGAAEIILAGEREVDTALAVLRERYGEAADAEIATAHAEFADLVARGDGHPAMGPGFDAAVATIVAAVLGEREA
jgi:hypothetical protein